MTLPKDAAQTVQALADRGIVGGYALDGNKLLVTATEITTDGGISALCHALKEILA